MPDRGTQELKAHFVHEEIQRIKQDLDGFTEQHDADITAIANDYSCNSIFARQVPGLAKAPGPISSPFGWGEHL